ncbi:MAG: type II secretion system F family protein [Planctomycetes bacterium]|nr:type II secretion system F family protein [Planctomycetota bacterium]
MPEFTFTALSKLGKRDTGTLTANSEREAASMLDARGLFPVQIKALKAKSQSRSGRKVKGRVVATFYAQLADLMHSGVPLLKALDLLENMTANKALAEVLREVRAKVADGVNLAEAMKPFPMVFNELSVSMVKAGLEGGFLENVLKRIATFTEHQEDMKGKVVGALAYPVFLGVVGLIVVNVLVIFFVPKFEAIFKRLEEKGELPLLTIWLMRASHFMQNFWFVMIGLFGAIVYGIRRWLRSERGRLTWDRVRLKLPAFGKLYLSLSLSRFTRILGTMMHNGIPILKALQIAKDSTGNKVLAQAIEESAENITGGAKLADPFRRNAYFPKDVVEMIAIAEESNTLDKTLIDIADSLEKRSSRQLELFVRLLEPVMLLVMAMAILAVVLGLLLPIFKMGSAVG